MGIDFHLASYAQASCHSEAWAAWNWAALYAIEACCQRAICADCHCAICHWAIWALWNWVAWALVIRLFCLGPLELGVLLGLLWACCCCAALAALFCFGAGAADSLAEDSERALSDPPEADDALKASITVAGEPEDSVPSHRPDWHAAAEVCGDSADLRTRSCPIRPDKDWFW